MTGCRHVVIPFRCSSFINMIESLDHMHSKIAKAKTDLIALISHVALTSCENKNS